MKPHRDAGAHHRSQTEERRAREAGLDKTIEASFPASDPPSSNPNPDAYDAVDEVGRADADTRSSR